jgi:hypothetical protein
MENGIPIPSRNSLLSEPDSTKVNAAPETLPKSITIINIDAQLPALPYVIKESRSDLSSKSDSNDTAKKCKMNAAANQKSLAVVGTRVIGMGLSFFREMSSDCDLVIFDSASDVERVPSVAISGGPSESKFASISRSRAANFEYSCV